MWAFVLLREIGVLKGFIGIKERMRAIASFRPRANKKQVGQRLKQTILRIIVWNIKKLTYKKVRTSGSEPSHKLHKVDPEEVTAPDEGIGMYVPANNLLDFISKTVSCHPMFAQIPFLRQAEGPIDLFVIIEVMEVEKGKGKKVETNYSLLMNELVKALNNWSAITFAGGNVPVYAYAPSAVDDPKGVIVSAGDETYGFIYNTNTLTLHPDRTGGLLDNPSNPIPKGKDNHPKQRLPLLINFTRNVVPGDWVSVIACHAPPTGGDKKKKDKREDYKYRPGVMFSNQLRACTQASISDGVTPLSNLPGVPPNGSRMFIMGDFNCSIKRSYKLKNADVEAFKDLYVAEAPNPVVNVRFGSTMGNAPGALPDKMLTSLQRYVKNEGKVNGPYVDKDYLEEQYDDILYSYPAAPNVVSNRLDVVGLIENRNIPGETMNQAGQVYTTFSPYLTQFFHEISDHLPVGIQYNYE